MDNKELNISIFSYNVFWQVMKQPSPLTKSLGKKKLNNLKKNILKNIEQVKNYYNPYFYFFQEAENYSEITKLFEKKEYEFHIGYSKPEHMLTIWQKKFFKLKFIMDGEFEAGRPFCIFVIEDLRFRVKFILINIHAGHHPNTLETIFEPIQKLLDKNFQKLKKFDIKRIIISGDFNRDISSEINIEPKKYVLTINSFTYNFFSFQSNNKTCCSIKGYGYNRNIDQTIDSIDNPIFTYPLNKETWYKSESSDHVGIISVVKNFI